MVRCLSELVRATERISASSGFLVPCADYRIMFSTAQNRDVFVTVTWQGKSEEPDWSVRIPSQGSELINI